MKRWLTIGALMFVFGSTVCHAGENISVAAKGSYTTSTRFLYNVERNDIFIDDKYFSYNFGFGLDVRMLAFSDDILIGVNIEKIKTLGQTTKLVYGNGLSYSIPVTEGFVVYPVELSGYFLIPFSSEDARVYLGGGVGWYFGERIYSIASAQAATLNSPSGFGIHVLTGADVRITSKIAVRGELKFRDPQFDSVNRFEESSTTYNGLKILLDPSSSKTRVNLNGITYGLGLVFLL
jgi:opacity protein-like surface antigen